MEKQISTLVFNKTINEGVKRAVRDRLRIMLELEEKSFDFWNGHVRSKLNLTRQDQVERRFNKEIQAFKIVIHKLTPFCERTGDEPSIVVKKVKPKRTIKGYLPPSTTISTVLNPDQFSLLAKLADLLAAKH